MIMDELVVFSQQKLENLWVGSGEQNQTLRKRCLPMRGAKSCWSKCFVMSDVRLCTFLNCQHNWRIWDQVTNLVKKKGGGIRRFAKVKMSPVKMSPRMTVRDCSHRYLSNIWGFQVSYNQDNSTEQTLTLQICGNVTILLLWCPTGM